MYKVLHRERNGELYSITKDWDRIELGDLVHHYTVGQWNKTKNGLPFLAFKTQEQAEDFAYHNGWSSSNHLEIWYCHAREVKPVEYVIDPQEAHFFSILVHQFWAKGYLKDITGYYYALRGAPEGTVSCKLVKLVEPVSVIHPHINDGHAVPYQEFKEIESV